MKVKEDPGELTKTSVPGSVTSSKVIIIPPKKVKTVYGVVAGLPSVKVRVSKTNERAKRFRKDITIPPMKVKTVYGEVAGLPSVKVSHSVSKTNKLAKGLAKTSLYLLRRSRLCKGWLLDYLVW